MIWVIERLRIWAGWRNREYLVKNQTIWEIWKNMCPFTNLNEISKWKLIAHFTGKDHEFSNVSVKWCLWFCASISLYPWCRDAHNNRRTKTFYRKLSNRLKKIDMSVPHQKPTSSISKPHRQSKNQLDVRWNFGIAVPNQNRPVSVDLHSPWISKKILQFSMGSSKVFCIDLVFFSSSLLLVLPSQSPLLFFCT